eukprot:890790-Alexandrium_andersonii.AAC.1
MKPRGAVKVPGVATASSTTSPSKGNNLSENMNAEAVWSPYGPRAIAITLAVHVHRRCPSDEPRLFG